LRNTRSALLDIAGASVLSYGLIISKASLSGDTDKENLRLPPVRDRLKQSRNAAIGLALLVGGFLCQIVGAWPT
jgi:hypothetical protein